jgi:hypothetical protein
VLHRKVRARRKESDYRREWANMTGRQGDRRVLGDRRAPTGMWEEHRKGRKDTWEVPWKGQREMLGGMLGPQIRSKLGKVREQDSPRTDKVVAVGHSVGASTHKSVI